MNKFYSFLLIGTLALGLNANAQRVAKTNTINKQIEKTSKKSFQTKSFTNFTQNELKCGYFNPLGDNELAIYSSGDDGEDGFVAGTNTYGDVAKANYFDFSSTNYTSIDSVGIQAYVDVSDYDLPISIIAYDGTSGKPGAKLAQINTTCEAIADAMDDKAIFTAKFSTSLALPASKKIFIAVDFSNLVWEDYDDFSLFSTEEPITTNIAWEQYPGNSGLEWASFADNWGFSTALTIFPYVCEDIATPVSMSAVVASNNILGNTISWSTISEIGNKGFEIERSADGKNFTKIAFVATKAINGNSSASIQYSFVDESPLAGENYYRVKQIDANSNATYSNIAKIARNLSIIDNVTLYPNPATDRINISLKTINGKKSAITLYNSNGQLVKQLNILGTGNAVNTSINLENLAKGVYIIKVDTDGKFETSKFIKK